MKPLTDRQKEVYNAIAAFHDTRGCMPTLRELMAVLKIKSPNGMMCHMDALLKKGWIDWPHDSETGRCRPLRSLRLLGTPSAPFVAVEGTGVKLSVPRRLLSISEAWQLAMDVLAAIETITEKEGVPA